MNSNQKINLLIEFDSFVEHLRGAGRLIRKSSFDDSHTLFEFFSPLFLPSSASVWRVTVGYMATSVDSRRLERVHQGFFELHGQCNVTRLIIFSDSPVDEGLQEYLNELDVLFIDLSAEIDDGMSFNDLYSQLENLLYPEITPEEIAQFSSPQELPSADAEAPTKAFFYKALCETLAEHRRALRLLPYYMAIPMRGESEPIANLTSLDFGGSFFASVEHGEKGSNAFIYPNRFHIHRVLHSSRLLIAQLNAMETPEGLSAVSDALQVTCSTIIHLYLSVLYRSDLHDSMAKLFTSLEKLSHEDCVSLLLDDIEVRPPDEQIFAIDAAVQLNGPSDIVVRTLIKGAGSGVKTVAVNCIDLLGHFGVREALPLLEELKGDVRQRIRDAAEKALTLIESNVSRGESEREAISIDDLRQTAGGDLADRETVAEAYSKAGRNSFFLGPNGTVINVMLWNVDSDSCVATTNHEDGTRDMALGNRFGMVTNIVGRLTGRIQPSPDHEVKMGEAAIFNPDGSVERFNADGSVERINLSGKEDSDDDKA
jgi:hypothetical protein